MVALVTFSKPYVEDQALTRQSSPSEDDAHPVTSDANQMNNEMRLKDFETSTFPLSLRLYIICHTLTITAHSRASFVFCSVLPNRPPQKKTFILRYCETQRGDATQKGHLLCPRNVP